MTSSTRRIILKASLATLLSIAASLGLAVTIVPMLGGVVDGNAWLMCILCPLLIAWPASAWQFRRAQRLRDAHGEIERLHCELSAAHDALVEKARRDSLTGMLNRESFLAELGEAMAEGGPGTLLFIDADHFKQVNDRFGHLVGDAALRTLAKAITDAIGKDGVSGRFGGEEFAVYLPGVVLRDARPTAGRILDAVRRLRIEARGGGVVGLTVSIGAAGQTGASTRDELIAQADEQLYRAKTQGRNRAVFPLDVAAVA
ncbi:Diguanylate cyclase (GGDEF) domain-containing protein [Hyphomicrobiales bacterium]|nr:Diguanylate cyclase (GGDEF) domain-containing protein [Hyphomicrobiales bacterium]CAH1699989.1 GGDEF domain-containing protein [Hyphomicrobiales bacterium]CAI0343746.1 GGDEF domain-containing protein [Hyphomicrobiales bacterium]